MKNKIIRLIVILSILAVFTAGWPAAVVEAAPNALYTVNTTDDFDPGDGTCDIVGVGDGCTLRDAINEANGNAGLDTIQFDISGASPYVISPVSLLPDITDAVIIDGESEPDYAGTPIIWLEGSLAGSDGLVITAGGSTIRGLIVSGFAFSGIYLSGSGGNTIERNYIGTDDSGSAAAPNGFEGIYVSNVANNLIEGNVISGNGTDGISLSGSSASGNLIYGNFIGVSADGAASVPNTSAGVFVLNSPNNVIGGILAGQRNVISGNGGRGIDVSGATATGNTAKGNYVGYGADGSTALANGGGGFALSTAGSSLVAAGNQVRGAGAQPAFRVSGGTLTAYANNLSGFSAGLATTGGTFNGGHNWWGSAFTQPTGLSAAVWQARLGAPVASWAEGSGSATPGSAVLSGGTGTAVIVSHGRGLSGAPFGNGVAPFVDQMCSEFYDFFTVGGGGTWQADVPVDNNAACNTNILTPMLLAWIPPATVYSTECTPADNAACWDGVPTARVQAPGGQILRITGLTVPELGGTQIVAGDSSGNDPTTISLADFTARAGTNSWLVAIAAAAGLFTLGAALIVIKRLITHL